MALPDFHNFEQMLARVKRADQSWGNLFREISSGRLKAEAIQEPLLQAQVTCPSLILVLSSWDFYSSGHLDQAAKDYGVKSWQVTEFIEALRESLAITETDLIVYEPVKSEADTHPEKIPSLLKDPIPSVGMEKVDQGGSHCVPPQSSVPKIASSTTHNAPSKTVLGLTALISALFVILISLVAVLSGQRRVTSLQSPSSTDSVASPHSAERVENAQATPPSSSTEEVYFSGIDLPVTNSLCNKKRTFCIYNLARLVESENGQATYTFSDIANGEQVNITGVITIENIDKSSGNRSFTFAFRDDQGSTTPGWAAAGYFKLDQDKDSAKPGILTKFKTTESFGPKTPVGLENTSYLFPS